MSWLTKIFTDIGHVAVKVVQVATSPAATLVESEIPIVGGVLTILNPTIGALVKKGGDIVTTLEGLITTAKAGALKHDTAVNIAVSEMPQLEELIKEFGGNVKIPEAELKAALDASVASFNAYEKLYAAIKAENAKPAV